MKIGITIGDPAGIGPEIIGKFFKNIKTDLTYEDIEWVIFGTPELTLENTLLVDQARDLDWTSVRHGVPCEVSASIQKRALYDAIAWIKAGKIDAIVTAPWTKSSFRFLGEKPVGHTEILEAELGTPRKNKAVMLLAGDALRVALLTTHIPLSQVHKKISVAGIHEISKIVYDSLQRDFGIAKPSLAILGLNPHAGEEGAMGREEIDIIRPAIAELKGQGLEIEGPFSADTYFVRYLYSGAGKCHDAVICMYHDQGLIPLKTIHFGASANITIGLAHIRTSVDHGTAHDIAGKGIANPESLKYAIDRAISMVKNRAELRSNE